MKIFPLARAKINGSLCAIFLTAFTLRFIFGVLWISPYAFLPEGDASAYDLSAQNLVAGRGLSTTSLKEYPPLPDTRRMPLYPIFLATIYKVFGTNYTAARVMQAFMASLLCIMIYYLGSTMFNQSVGLMAASYAAIYQPFIRYLFYGGPAFLLSEQLFSFLLVLMGLVLSTSILTESLSWFFISGIFLGLSTLMRSEIFLFPIFVFLILLYKASWSLKRSLRQFGLITLAFLLMLAPWIFRNYRVHRSFVPLTTLGGRVFYYGNNPLAKGGYAIPEIAEEEFIGLSEVQLDRLYYKKGIEFLKNYPKNLPKLFLKKILVHWFVRDHNAFNLFYSFMLPFAIYGFILILYATYKGWTNASYLIPIAFVVYSSLIALVFFGQPRFRLSIEPYLIIMAAYGFSSILKTSSLMGSVTLVSCWLIFNILVLIQWNKVDSVLRSFASWMGLG